jgi:WD40 repeat protein
MPVLLTCPNPACGREYRAADTAAGKTVRCPQCKQTIAIPLTATATAATVARPSTADDSRPPLAKPATVNTPSLQSVGRFVVKGKVGEGAFGAVYRAFDPQLDREVALKVPHAAVLDSPKRVERFLREAKAAANLRHPHIVPVFDAGSDGGRHYIASAFINGQKLADAVEASDGGLDIDRAARLVRELAEALAYAHEQGIVHRDVKPDNVMLDAADRVHLMDFGLAVKQDAESRLTSDGAVMGTPSYMSPEQAKGDTANVGPAADQYACGVVLYELLTGKVPFTGPIPVVIHNQIHTDPDPPTKLRRAIPRDLEQVCLMALNKKPEERYKSCEELADDLRRWQESEPVSVRPLNTVEKAARWVRKNPAVAGLVMASGLAVVLLGVAVGFAVLGLQAEFARNKAEEAEGKAVNSRDAAERAKSDAEQSRDEAERAKGVADAARVTAEEARRKADEARGEAERQEKKAKEEKGRADAAAAAAKLAEGEARKAEAAEKLANERLTEQQTKLEVVEYGRTIQVAYQEWRDNNPAAVRALLDGTKGEHRGWEWGYLHRLHDPTLATFPHAGGVASLAVGPDGKVFTGTADGLATVWGDQTDQPIHSFPRFAGGVRVAFSPDGTRVATGDGTGDVRVWDTTGWREVAALKGHTENVTAVAFSGDGKRLVTGSLDGTARVWDVPARKEVVSFPKHRGAVWAVAISPKGDRAASASGGTTVRVWDTAKGEEWHTLEHPQPVNAVAFSPDGKKLATAGVDRTVRVWDAATGKEQLPLAGHTATVLAVAFNHDGTRVASAGEDRVVRVWDVASGREVLTLKGHTARVNAVAFTRTGDRLISGSDDQTARVWDAVTGAEYLSLVGHAAAVNAVTFHPKRSQVVTAGEDNTVRVWDPATGRGGRPLENGHTGPAHVAAFAADRERLVTAGDDKTAKVWDTATGRVIRSLDQHGDFVRAAAISPDGRWVVAGCDDGSAKVWEVPAEKAPFPLTRQKGGMTAHAGGVNAVAFSKAGDRIVTTGKDHKARVWDAKSNGEVAELAGHTREVLAAAFDPNGPRVITASADGLAKVWDVAAPEKELFTLKGHTAAVTAAAFHPTEKRIVTASHDRTVKVWDAVTGAELLTLKGFPEAVNAVAWDTDGTRLAVGGGGGTARIFDCRKFRDSRPLTPEAKK